MKKIFTLSLLTLLFLQAKAQDWNVSNMTAGNITSVTTYEGLTLYASDTKYFTIESNSKTIDGESYTQRLKTNGSSTWNGTTPSERVLAFPVTGNTTITVYALSGSSSATDRYVEVLYLLNDTKTQIIYGNVSGTLQKFSGTYIGDATTIYVDAPVGAINMYRILAESEISNDIEDREYTGEIVSTDYYNLRGVLISHEKEELSNGIYIKKVTYNDGKVKTSKISVIY